MLLAAAVALLLPGAAYAAQEQPADGTYTADYLVLKAEDDSVSMANDYWEKPAVVTFDKGSVKVQLTINHSKWVTEFKVPGKNGGYVDTMVVNTNESEDTRLVEFAAADISKPILSKIHVTVPEIDYDHDYTIRLSFKADSFKPVQAAEPSVSTKAPTSAAAAKPTAEAADESADRNGAAAAAAKPSATAKPAATAQPAEGPAGSTAVGAAERPAPTASATVPAEAQGESLSEEDGTAAGEMETAAPTVPEAGGGGQNGEGAAGGEETGGSKQGETETFGLGDPASNGEAGASAANAKTGDGDGAQAGGGLIATAQSGAPAASTGWIWWLAAAAAAGGGVYYTMRLRARRHVQ